MIEMECPYPFMTCYKEECTQDCAWWNKCPKGNELEWRNVSVAKKTPWGDEKYEDGT